MSKINIAVLGSTSGTDLQAIIDAKQEGKLENIDLSVVISNQQKAYILKRAEKNNIPAVFVDAKGKTREEYDHALLGILKVYKIDFILCIGWMRILSPKFVQTYKKKIANIHPSLLPKYAGGMDLNVHAEVLKNNEKESGCTLHWIDEGVDTGEIITQKKVEIKDNETSESLKKKVQKAEGELFVEFLKNYQSPPIGINPGASQNI
ncbi:MAG: phosphoribosylglycinamide formyltransferase [Patescibacteria group bacterium]